MKFEINLNDFVEVVLTEMGAAVYNEFYEKLNLPEKYLPPLKLEGDVHRDQLWHIMQVFGPCISIGLVSPFEFNKMTIKKELVHD
jgi:hypothetical protein